MLFSRHLNTSVVAAGFIGNVAAGLPFVGRRKAPEVAGDVVVHGATLSLKAGMVKVQETLASVATMPSCRKLAAEVLLGSCETFKDLRGAQQYTGDEFLESFQQLYAIRATNCEHLDANDVLPNICRPLLETDYHGDPPIPGIKKCLEALNSGKHNQWTTYNNIKTEGLLMCHAVRTQADKDDTIALYKILASLIGDVNSVVILQKDELEALHKSLLDINGQTREFQDLLRRDNREIKAEMKGFSVELKGRMEDINEQARMMLQVVNEYQAELNSAIALAKARSEETDMYLAAHAETQQYHLELFQDKSEFTLQKIMQDFHSYASKVSQSVEIANDKTAILASKIAAVTIGLDAPLQRLAGVNSAVNELADTVYIIQATSTDTIHILEKSAELAGGLLNHMDAILSWFENGLSNMGSFTLYFTAIFPLSLIFWARTISRMWAPFAAFAIALYLSTAFVFVHSPFALGRTILASHPTLFSPVIWSVLTSITFGIILGEAAKYIYRCFFHTICVDHQLRLPIDEYEAVSGKV